MCRCDDLKYSLNRNVHFNLLTVHFVWQVEHGSFAGEIIEESAICVLAPHQVNQAMTYFTAFSSFGLYVVPVIVLPVVYSR